MSRAIWWVVRALPTKRAGSSVGRVSRRATRATPASPRRAPGSSVELAPRQARTAPRAATPSSGPSHHHLPRRRFRAPMVTSGGEIRDPRNQQRLCHAGLERNLLESLALSGGAGGQAVGSTRADGANAPHASPRTAYFDFGVGRGASEPR